MNTLYIHAVNVHTGGGRSLLDALLKNLPSDVFVVAQLDARMAISETLPSGLTVRRVRPSIWNRFKAEWWLSRNAGSGDLVLCFGNLPPLFNTQAAAWVFVQNRYLIDSIRRRNFPLRVWLRLQIERLWLKSRAANASGFIVQTPSMKAVLESSGCCAGRPVQVWPFVASSQGYKRGALAYESKATGFDFVYVASGEPHKNHRGLIEAWRLLARDGQFPSLALTLDEKVSPELCRWIAEQSAQLGLRVENLCALTHDGVLQIYKNTKALIYPSDLESFGLPLVEAKQAGLAVLASELDYVRDVLDPEQSFDPHSPVSIARAVKRFMGLQEQPLPLLSADQFLARLIEQRR